MALKSLPSNLSPDKRTPLEKARALHIAVTERFNALI